MKFFDVLLVLAGLNTSVLAELNATIPAASKTSTFGGSVLEPAANQLDELARIVTCTPRFKQPGGRIKQYQVDVGYAQAQAKKGGFREGRTGYPHRYKNHERLVFGTYNCDKARAHLMEYPIYWNGNGNEWQKDGDKKKQPGRYTPIRVVYANQNGALIYCGVMTHEFWFKNRHGAGDFKLCV
ncbi:hirsutellin A toxin [Penicillium brevicompactum]|uniref:Hirsutellin A toxin n=1 Tax=Penicillium brevicompactum TaxID=5074 RepID=A0A9W9RKN2_PENBR|nr:hirsutellin A toxin [Penicillium brevicompactum]